MKKFHCTLNIFIYKFGGTVWESNPPDLARRSQAVLKTVEDTSTPFSPVSSIKECLCSFICNNIIQFNIVIIKCVDLFVTFSTTILPVETPEISISPLLVSEHLSSPPKKEYNKRMKIVCCR
jgi:hypothetical protein